MAACSIEAIRVIAIVYEYGVLYFCTGVRRVLEYEYSSDYYSRVQVLPTCTSTRVQCYVFYSEFGVEIRPGVEHHNKYQYSTRVGGTYRRTGGVMVSCRGWQAILCHTSKQDQYDNATIRCQFIHR
jgi:hypothetical protein